VELERLERTQSGAARLKGIGGSREDY
jgi:hypothetical protein